MPLRRTIVSVVIAAAAAVCGDAQAAAPSPEQQLASRYAPVVALKRQRELCGPGEAYRPVLVDVVLGRNDVSLFNGSKSRYRRVRRAPTATDLFAGPFEHYVDLPGHPVSGACSYQHWFRRVGARAPNAVYAHIATEPGRPGRLALQYWLYYVYNDYNDKHESDWEQIQLHFDADTAEQALQRPPVEVLYSQHEGAERAAWDDEKLEKVAGTHVVTYPGAGSHANYYRNGLWLGRSADEGLGCDDSTAPSRRIRPLAVLVPERAPPPSRFAWITFGGHWGQREKGFNDGPLGPNAKVQWEQPFTWAESVERKRSFSISSGEHGGLDASALFCSGVTGASDLLDGIYASRWLVLGLALVLLALLALLASRTRWRPAPVRPLEQRRAGGQILRASFGVYRLDWQTLFVVSALVLPLTFLGALALHVAVQRRRDSGRRAGARPRDAAAGACLRAAAGRDRGRRARSRDRRHGRRRVLAAARRAARRHGGGLPARARPRRATGRRPPPSRGDPSPPRDDDRRASPGDLVPRADSSRPAGLCDREPRHARRAGTEQAHRRAALLAGERADRC